MDKKKRNMTADSENEQQVFSDEDLRTEILSRLPVKSVIRCRCVCKAWRVLISHPLFVKKYTSRHTKSKSSSRLLLPTFPLRSVDYEAPGVEVAFRKHYYPVSLPKPKRSLEIYGSCHGLVCLAIDYHIIILWNPSTGESNLLPIPPSRTGYEIVYYGFGYDSTTQDYKIVRGDDFKCPKFVFEVFSLKRGSWRQHPLVSPTFQLTSFDDVFGGIGQGLLTNEALHWIDMSHNDVAILVFSLAEEKFRRMLPNIYDGDYFRSEIGIVGDCLAVYFEDRGDGGSSLWVMKEYGVEESWTQVLQFYPSGCLRTLNCPPASSCLTQKHLKVYPSGCLPGPNYGPIVIHTYPQISSFCLRPLCLLENGDLLLDNTNGDYNHFPIYDPKTQTFRDLIQICDLKTRTLRNIDAGLWTPSMDEVKLERPTIGPTIYAETLVSPLIGSM